MMRCRQFSVGAIRFALRTKMAGRKHGGRSLFCGLGLALMGAAAPFGGLSAEPGSAQAFQVAEIVPVVVTPEAAPARAAEPEDKKTTATKRVQRCYAKLGYYKGPIDGKASDATWTAHWYFKNDHGLKSHGNFLSKKVQKKIEALCGDDAELEAVEAAVPETPEPAEVAITPEPAQPAEPSQPPEASQAQEVSQAPQVSEPPAVSQTPEVSPVSEAREPAKPPVPEDRSPVSENLAEAGEPMVTARLSTQEAPVAQKEPPLLPKPLGIDCLPEDLITVLRAAHGEGVTARICRPGCLPPPKGLSQAQLDDLYGRYGVVWCHSCVQIGGHLALNDIKRIEDAGNLELCSTPPRLLPKPGIGNGNVVKSFSRIRELYRGLPSVPENEGAIAVIIGNSTYDNLPPAQTARNDAGAMYFFLTEHLGFQQDHIIDLRNAKRADFERVFGPVPGSDGELKRLVRAQPDAKVIVYYSGHGATNASHSDSYLLPVDAQPYREERSGYPVSTLYDNLAGLDAKSVLILLESSFGRDHGTYLLPPNIPETTRSVLPVEPLPSLTVLAAADRGQRALLDTDYDVGLFTRYLIEGLAGGADLYPVGNGNNRVDSAEFYAFTAAMVRLAARKTFGLLQDPVYSSAGTAVLKAPEEVAAKPN